MRLVFKGIYQNDDQLPKSILPDNAVKFNEPNSLESMNTATLVFILPTFVFASLFIIGSYLIHGSLSIRGSLIGVLIYLFSIPLHELIHALAFGKGHIVELFIAPKQLAMFVTSTMPITKNQFIFVSLIPNIILGWIPLLVWMILPHNESYSNILLTFSILSVLVGVGDYLNVFNTIRQMPKGSMHQLSGFNSYWYMPQLHKEKDNNHVNT